MGSFKSLWDHIMKVVHSVEKFEVLLNIWLLRQLALGSFILHLLMAAYAPRRKHKLSDQVNWHLRFAYLLSDVITTTGLSIAARDYGKDSDPEHGVYLIWAMCLVLHLGGPDNFCAFSSYDHDLWLTHFIGFVLQTGNALYLLFKSRGNAYFFAAFPLFVAGSLKYGERSWVLRSLTTARFKASLKSNKSQNHGQRYIQLNNQHSVEVHNGNILLVVDFLFKRLKFLFAGIKLPISEGARCREQIRSLNSPKIAFRAIELQLGLLYDMLYTKATIIYSKFGILVRCISFLASVSALVTFWCVGKVHNSYDLSVTYVLLCGAVAMECLALIFLVNSDWTKLWLLHHPKQKFPLTNRLINTLKQERKGKKWSRTIVRFNLIMFCLEDTTKPKNRLRQLLIQYCDLPEHQLRLMEKVDTELLDLIYNHLQERIGMISNDLLDVQSCKKLLNYRGDFVLNKIKCFEDLSWSTVAVEFDHSLLLWHIATVLCYFDDDTKRPNGMDSDTIDKYSNIGLDLSDYMLYLLERNPDSLPKHTDKRRYREAMKEGIQFFKAKGVENMEKACEELLQHYQQSIEMEEDQSNSILIDGCRLAMQLQSLKPPNMENWGCKEKWEMMNMVWVELLTYAAAHCGWEQHIQHLRNGGELITHVCLLMVDLGLSLQYYN